MTSAKKRRRYETASKWGLAEKINAIREEYETYDWIRADAVKALRALGISRRRAELEVANWRKE